MNFITWLYFLEDKDNDKEIFLYGLSLPIIQEPKETKIDSIKISKNKRITLFTTISNQLNIIQDTYLIFDDYMKKVKFSINFIDKQNIILVSKEVNKKIPYSFLDYPINTSIYYTEDIYSYIDLIEIDILNEILYKLSKISGLEFQGVFFKHIGCFEIGNITQEIEHNNTLFKIRTSKQCDNINFYFDKNIEYENNEFIIHLITYNENSEVLSDVIYYIDNITVNRLLISLLDKDVAGYDYWVFDNNKQLLNREVRNFVKYMSFSINVQEQKYQIQKNNFSKKNPMSRNDQEVEVFTPVSKINLGNINDIKIRNNTIYNEIEVINKKEDIYKEGKWFKKEDYKELIDFFNKITKDVKYRLTIIDPFISSTACLEYLYHIKNTQVEIKLISCFAKSISPDDSDKKETIEEHIGNFILSLNNLQDFKLPVKNIEWYNFKEKSFHDRYLYIENLSSDENYIFSISNSLNNLLSNYENLLVMPLNNKVFKNAQEYINNLTLKCNDSNKIFPTKENL